MTNNENFNKKSDVHLVINIAQQMLTLYEYDKEVTQYTVSTAKNGIGSQQDSGCTPLGKHFIANKYRIHRFICADFLGDKMFTKRLYAPW